MIAIPETSVETYVSGKYALNIYSPEGTGDWHQTSTVYGESEPFLFLCGKKQQYDTNAIFGTVGIQDRIDTIKAMKVPFEGDAVYIANHARAIADLVIVLSSIKTAVRVIVLDDFMSTDEEKRQVLDMLTDNVEKIPENAREEAERWISKNTP